MDYCFGWVIHEFDNLGMVFSSRFSVIFDYPVHFICIYKKQEVRMVDCILSVFGFNTYGFHHDYSQWLVLSHPPSRYEISILIHGLILLQALYQSFSLCNGYFFRSNLSWMEKPELNSFKIHQLYQKKHTSSCYFLCGWYRTMLICNLDHCSFSTRWTMEHNLSSFL